MCIVWILCSESFFTFILSPHFILSTFGVFIVIHVRVFKCKYVNIITDNIIILSITVDIDGGTKTEQARRCRCCVWAAAGAEAEDDLPSQGETCCRGELVPSPLLRAHGGHWPRRCSSSSPRHTPPRFSSLVALKGFSQAQRKKHILQLIGMEVEARLLRPR